MQLLLHVLAGVFIGLAARALLPGAHSAGWLVVSLLSLAGSGSGALLAQTVLPGDVTGRGGYFLAGLGALAVLLVYAVVSG